MADVAVVPPIGQVGRPVGSIKEQKRIDKQNYDDYVNEITHDYATEVATRKLMKKRVA